MNEPKAPNCRLVNADGERVYRLSSSPLGRGTFGCVYSAIDEFESRYAIKLMALPTNPTFLGPFLDRFNSEARVLDRV